ncbi:hypothetical protein JOJ86_002937 [Rhodococcus percolatus]|nr:hypothetical protein [Rhodococcus opacus]MBP2205211.1 hypothetical protein [Rhodococcus opacus]
MPGSNADSPAAPADSITTAPGASTTTSVALGPLTQADALGYREELNAQVQPCVDPASSFSLACTKAIYTLVDTLEQFNSRLTTAFPKTRARVAETISNLEHWRDQCMTTTANSPERRACLP